MGDKLMPKNRRRGRKTEGTISKDREKGPHEVKSRNSSSYIAHKTLLIQFTDEEPSWFKLGEKQHPERHATVKTNPPTNNRKLNEKLVERYRSLADTIYRNEVQLFSNRKTADDRWVESTMKGGTLKDRIAAMSVTVSSNPIHKFYALDGLLQMAGCSESGHQNTNSRVAQLAAEALEDLFLNTFLPRDRKLLTLFQRPLYLYESSEEHETKKTLSPRVLLLWRFEEMVRDKYEIFLKSYLGHTLREGVELQKIAALRSAGALLRGAPEGEATVLQLISNKLGDPGKKIAAAASHELRRVLLQHPAMQEVIAREVQQLAHRPNLSSRALYNCITFLNQLKLMTEEEVSEKGKPSFVASLVNTYFRLFEFAVNKPNADNDTTLEETGMKSRLLSALLTGVNRAHAYLPDKHKGMEEHIDSLYRVVHAAPPAASTQALLLLFHVIFGTTTVQVKPQPDHTGQLTGMDSRKDRFYRALYSSLGRGEMVRSGKHLTMFFNLLYKALKNDTDAARIVTFAKRILLSTVHSGPQIVAASLFLLSEISKVHRNVLSSFEDTFQGIEAGLVLDPSKREPRGAIVSADEIGGKSEEQKMFTHVPGWELSLAIHHYHPSVQKFASNIGRIEYNGDPLKDFSLGPFLDKFAYRNPRSIEKVVEKFKKRQSVAERRSGYDNVIRSQFSLPFNDPSFAERTDVSVEDEFFHRFFVERSRRDKIKGIERHRATDDGSEGSSGAEELALDADEEKHDDKDFATFESQWESDPEEEAFVDSLAEKIIEDSMQEYGPEELDEEDPDMEGWGDLNDHGDQDDEISDDSSTEEGGDAGDDDHDKENIDEDNDDDDDAFMDEDSSSGSESSVLVEDEVESASDDMGVEFNDSASDEDDLAFAADLSSDEGEPVKKNKAKRSKETLSTFASAEEYEEMIQESWGKLKRQRIESTSDEQIIEQGSKKKKKSKSQRNR